MKLEDIIYVKGRLPRKKSRRWPADPSDRSKFLSRRRRRPIYLNLYDLGQLAGGTTIDWFQTESVLTDAAPFYTPFSSGPAGSGSVIATSELPPGTPELLDYLFIDTEDDWPDIYRNITETFTSYNFDVTEVGTFVEDKGLPINRATVTEVTDLGWNFSDCEYLVVGLSTPSLKITSERDVGADEVELVIDKSVDVFIVPAVYTTSAVAQDNTAADLSVPYLPQEWVHALDTIRPLPRSTVANSDWATLKANRPDQTGTSQTVLDYYASLFINNGDTATLISSPDPEDYVNPGFFLPPGDFSIGTNGFPSAATSDYATTSNTNGFVSSGQLVAAVRKHITSSTYEWYYIWKLLGASSGAIGLLVQDSVEI